MVSSSPSPSSALDAEDDHHDIPRAREAQAWIFGTCLGRASFLRVPHQTDSPRPLRIFLVEVEVLLLLAVTLTSLLSP
ncbi:hypothetical protein TorRG33x02_253420 [Trema orientale]|uniref:Uncharacterized protein n=1 Tax=Trema orientale TaxID=63057 RepID=A0A2P5DER8_TREOI|nr:hypothetical protein TorRG33x02_253420 [Trema orientale]